MFHRNMLIYLQKSWLERWFLQNQDYSMYFVTHSHLNRFTVQNKEFYCLKIDQQNYGLHNVPTKELQLE